LYHNQAGTGAQGVAFAKTFAEKRQEGVVPYFVSGPLSDKAVIGWAGAILHVIAWALGVLFDVLLVGKIYTVDDDYQTVLDKRAHDYWLWSFILFCIALGVLLLLTGLHAGGAFVIREGATPPFLMTIITAGAIITNLFAFLLVEIEPSGLWGYMNLTDVDEKNQFASDYRHFAIWALLSKVYIWQFIANNQARLGASNLERARTFKETALTHARVCRLGRDRRTRSRRRARREPQRDDADGVRTARPPAAGRAAGRVRRSGLRWTGGVRCYTWAQS
jgi:hypothetical protein